MVRFNVYYSIWHLMDSNKKASNQKIRRYLPVLLSYMQRRVEGGRGAVISVRTRDICGMDRRCGVVVYSIMMRFVERGLARRHKQGTYLIERRVAEEVISALRRWI